MQHSDNFVKLGLGYFPLKDGKSVNDTLCNHREYIDYLRSQVWFEEVNKKMKMCSSGKGTNETI